MHIDIISNSFQNEIDSFPFISPSYGDLVLVPPAIHSSSMEIGTF
ncbi:hypothetical protein LEP1GSC161_3071 [Leptospira santarosai str. CBC1416]|uniref:Uncharacterized protein n=2 Tax=Leptospira santarosai TaxID=28183 RepID=M6UW07_9LEPT|nr:hypothetical protein LEP1GSC169_1662 [Leptospira santarosai str. HAI1349]EMM88444.1 hypothetical protein LEP1GSC039_3241 [Leptospira santarosai str. 2000027870]EMO13036.1 hypothetical protein LEP1GSC165_1864 [Leptospira santarosai str. CBC523]EMO46921.1 hypothetical protein LEP1GSC187_4169 [Leptospira santarosai str. ZUN179]EMO59684.1 hypothetical protein LEP1GSC161_3071 [Leptospira santarosai str. CBC1416]EMP04313.1 hypothetical protein LEP1GSC171_0321 [Leptospira santarosai str. HAI1380]